MSILVKNRFNESNIYNNSCWCLYWYSKNNDMPLAWVKGIMSFKLFSCFLITFHDIYNRQVKKNYTFISLTRQ